MLLNVLGWIGLISSLLYQGIALPQDIWRNYRLKSGPSMSTLMLALSTIAYTATTMRAALQPDWLDFGSRCVGAVSSLVLVFQAVCYWMSLSERLSFIHQKKGPSILDILSRHTRPLGTEELHFWVRQRPDQPWCAVSSQVYRRVYASEFFPFAARKGVVPLYFQGSNGLTGICSARVSEYSL
jgi:hypothetical protein